MKYNVFAIKNDLVPMQTFEFLNITVRDGVYIFYKSHSNVPTAIFPIEHYYVMEVTE